MKFKKAPITIDEQIKTLKNRGLKFNDEVIAAHYLSNISYYRLRAYTFPFQDNQNPNHPFVKNISFEEIIQLYVFDRQLRLLIFNAIEKIEISFRTKVIYNYSLNYGSHWHLNPNLYNNSSFFASQIASLQVEVDRSNETFIKHYKSTYTDPKDPPSWMSIEVCSMGLLSKIFSNLKKDKCKDFITGEYGLKDVDILTNWMYCFSLIRNICAHHGRIWNRRLNNIKIPNKTSNQFIDDKRIYPNKIYSAICCIQYTLNIISPKHDFKAKLLSLMSKCPLLQEKEMGFPPNWRLESFWS
jgi:abortive infection bacteriophage resistance protein